jgi:hypothetical protein
VPAGLLTAIDAMGSGRTARVAEGGEGVDVVVWAQPDRRRVLLHLDRHEAGPNEPMAMRVAIPDGWDQPETVRFLGLSGDEREVAFTCTAGEVAFTVDAPEWYGVVVVGY